MFSCCSLCAFAVALAARLRPPDSPPPRSQDRHGEPGKVFNEMQETKDLKQAPGRGQGIQKQAGGVRDELQDSQKRRALYNPSSRELQGKANHEADPRRRSTYKAWQEMH